MPQHNKHATALTTIATAQAYIRELAATGAPTDKVAALQQLADYARERAEQGVAKAERDYSSKSKRNKAINVPVTFKDHVYAHAEDHTHVATVVENSLRDFIQGEWTPPAPRRARSGEKPESTMINVRIDMRLWNAANDQGKDPKQVAARGGYKLTAAQVAIAALAEAFGQPDTEDSTSGATA